MKTITYDETAWQLVPKEPTNEILGAALEASASHDRDYPNDGIRRSLRMWAAMLSAAPPAPVVQRSELTDTLIIDTAHTNCSYYHGFADVEDNHVFSKDDLIAFARAIERAVRGEGK